MNQAICSLESWSFGGVVTWLTDCFLLLRLKAGTLSLLLRLEVLEPHVTLVMSVVSADFRWCQAQSILASYNHKFFCELAKSIFSVVVQHSQKNLPFARLRRQLNPCGNPYRLYTDLRPIASSHHRVIATIAANTAASNRSHLDCF